jgi:hypothetical protein
VTEVGKEIFERQPSFTNDDASATVVLKILIAPVRTALKHTFPGLVFSAFISLACLSMCSAMASILSPMSAGFSVSTAQLLALHNGFFPAIADAKPEILSIPLLDRPQGCKGTEALASDVDYSWAGHCSLLSRLLCQAAVGCSPSDRRDHHSTEAEA